MSAAPSLAPASSPFAILPFRASAIAGAYSGTARRRPLRATDEASSDHPVVLVVEPDERTRSLLHGGLTSQGFEVLAAASGEEALRFLSPDRPLPAIVFAESDLRQGDGFALCQQIRSDQRTADLPIVLLSRTAESYHRELAGGAGADQYLPKPLYLNDVIALARLMGGRSSSEARYEADTARLPLAHALRAMLSGVRAGRIEMQRERAFIAFREGRVVDCGFEDHRGEEALARLLLLGNGGYVVMFGPGLARGTMEFSLESLCRKTLPRLARWNKLVDRSVPLQAELVVDFAKLKTVIQTLPDEVNTVLRLFDGHRNVRSVISESTMDEVMALEVVTRLYVMGVLTPAVAEEIRPLSVAPAFFDPVQPVSLFEATGTLEPELLKQLEAFRIKTVVEPRPDKAFDPGVMTSPVPASAAFADFMRGDAMEEVTPVAMAPSAANTPGARADVEDLFFSTGEITQTTRTPNAEPRGWVPSLVIGLGLVAVISAVAVVAWPKARLAPPAPPAPAAVEIAPVAPAPVVGESPAGAAPVVVAASPRTTEVELQDGAEALAQASALYEGRKLKDAIALLTEITHADPTSSQAWMLMGLAKYDRGDAKGAEHAAMKTLALEPKNGRALVLLATVYLDQGHEQKARVELQRYLELYPNGQFAREAKQLLAQ